MNNWVKGGKLISGRDSSHGTLRRTLVCTCITCMPARKRRRSLKQEAAIPPRPPLQLRGLFNTAVTTRSILSMTALGSRHRVQDGLSRFSSENGPCHWTTRDLVWRKNSQGCWCSVMQWWCFYIYLLNDWSRTSLKWFPTGLLSKKKQKTLACGVFETTAQK